MCVRVCFDPDLQRAESAFKTARGLLAYCAPKQYLGQSAPCHLYNVASCSMGTQQEKHYSHCQDLF